MPRIIPVDPAVATGDTKKMLDGVHTKLGVTPNLMRTLGVAPAALRAYLDFSNTLAAGVFDLKFREQIALAVAQTNGCGYCLAAHRTLGALAGLTAEEMRRSRQSRSLDPKREAGLQFAHTVVTTRGQVSDRALATIREAGYTDAEIVEIVANVVLNIFTNYLNLVADTAIDFPPVEDLVAAEA